MAEALTFKYDREGDILYIDKVCPYAEQETAELGDDVIARLNPKTGEIENLEVLFFLTRFLRSELADEEAAFDALKMPGSLKLA